MEQIVVRDDRARMRAVAYLSLLGLIFVGLVLAIPLIFFYSDEIFNTGTIPVLPSMILTVLMELAVIGLALWYTGLLKKTKDILRLRHFNLKNIAIGGSVGLFFFLGLLALEAIMHAIGVPVTDSDTSAMFADTSGITKFIVLFGFVSILVPICEELFFRGFTLGFLLRGHNVEKAPLKTKLGLWAVIFSSLYFAILHFQGASNATDFMVLIWTFLFAVTSSILFIKRDSIYPSMAAHMIYNFCSALVLFTM